MLLWSGDKWRHERLWPFQWLGQAWPHFNTVASFSWWTFITIASHFPYFAALFTFLSCFYKKSHSVSATIMAAEMDKAIILASSCEFKILDPLANFCKFVFASYVLEVIVWAYIKCCVWKCYLSKNYLQNLKYNVKKACIFHLTLAGILSILTAWWYCSLRAVARGGGFLNGQNLLSVTKVIFRQSAWKCCEF